jgi:hypothetical protein
MGIRSHYVPPTTHAEKTGAAKFDLPRIVAALNTTQVSDFGSVPGQEYPVRGDMPPFADERCRLTPPAARP